MSSNNKATGLSRREVLAMLCASLLPMRLQAELNGPAVLLQPNAIKEPPPVTAILRVFVDTLIPADNLSPAASALGVDELILQKAEADATYDRFLTLGCRWLNLQAQGDFSRLPEQLRERILFWMESSKPSGFPHRFFLRIRYDALSHFYSQPASWAGLGLTRPPQPFGYPDFRG